MKAEIYIKLLDEPYFRPTQAEILDANRYLILPIKNYEILDESWEFPPGTVVRCEKRESIKGGDFLLAVENIS